MIKDFKNRFRKAIKWFIALFIVMFLFRLLYGYVVVNHESDFEVGSYFNSVENKIKNYAQQKAFKVERAETFSYNVSQIYEKIATITTKTHEFEHDEKRTRDKIKTYNAVIQYERALGSSSDRQLHLVIGVNPDKFDTFYKEVQTIGAIKSKEVIKTDKTNEYHKLNAEKISIEKKLQSLNELKAHGGSIEEFISLNEKIFEVEEKLQSLGVELGNFDSENEFCTVRVSLYEGEAEKKISLLHRIKVVLEWTIKFYSVLVTAVFGAALSVLIILVIADKVRGFLKTKGVS